MSDVKFIVFWWLILTLLGFISLPLIFNIFKKFWDRGYIFSKIVSLALISYFLLVLSTIKILPFTSISLFILIAIFLLIDLIYLSRPGKFKEFIGVFKKNLFAFVFEESIFLLILTLWSFVRGYSPTIEGLEKYMDWGFINSMLRTTYLPPQDMWFSGSPINYYYFGHLMFAVLTKLSSISSAITYNLSIATVCALTFVSGFSISSNLANAFFKNKPKFKFKHIIIAGLISALLLTFGGNLHTVYKIAQIDIQNEGHLVLTQQAITKAASSYWYPDATRFIGFDPDVNDKTIHEFPLYSFVVADLHGHMNDIPVILFFCAFLFALVLKGSKTLLNWSLILVSGLTLSIAYMTNAWDFAVYGLLYAIFIFFLNLFESDFLTAFNKTVANGLLIIGTWYLFSLPFSLNFTPMMEGIRISDGHSPFYQLFVLYGGFWLISLPFILYFLFRLIKSLRKKIPLSQTFSTSDYFVFTLILTATILVIIPELIYIKDIYIYEHRRANTMFKLVYQAFIMYSLVSGYVIVRLSTSLKNRLLKSSFKLIAYLVITIHLIYPFFAIKSFYGLTEYQGLWGLAYLKDTYPDNYNAIEWINQNIKGQPVLLEAVGDSYTTFNQVSVATGLPTIEGWLVHEWLWRGGYDQPGARAEEVRLVYESENLNEIKSILQKYNVQYLFVGSKEYEKYPKLNTKNFEKIGGQIIFQSGDTKIFKI